MLAELMRLKWSVAIGGTHGKTTTTSMVAALIDAAGLDPTVINGGVINNYGTNARLGAGDWMVVEADESDGTFVKLPAVITIVTNMDPEHLDHYGTVEAMNRAYEDFVHNIPFYGFAVLCIDHPVVQAMIPRLSDRRVITYGFSPQADVRAVDLRLDPQGSTYNIVINDRFRETTGRIDDVHLPMVGQHNVQNSLAAIAVAHEMRIGDDVIRNGFAGFGGVKRRFTKTGEANGVTVIDDYGHHPVEIAAVLTAARQASRRQVIAVVQPHRYTRLHNLFEDSAPASTTPTRAGGRCLSGRRAADRRRQRRALVAGHARARPSPRRASAGSEGAGQHGGAAGAPATWSSASAPAASPIGRMRCRRAAGDSGHRSGESMRADGICETPADRPPAQVRGA
jgi:UDP-N-acetylmuramate--alanine ligase